MGGGKAASHRLQFLAPRSSWGPYTRCFGPARAGAVGGDAGDGGAASPGRDFGWVQAGNHNGGNCAETFVPVTVV